MLFIPIVVLLVLVLRDTTDTSKEHEMIERIFNEQ